jgi:hypothetical protein
VIFPAFIQEARLNTNCNALAVFLDKQGHGPGLNAGFGSAAEAVKL